MPNRDGTGPLGVSAMTGRRNGNCNGVRPNNTNCQGQGIGFRRGQGLGQGRMRGQLQTDELTLLQNQQKVCESRLDAIKNRIAELGQK